MSIESTVDISPAVARHRLMVIYAQKMEAVAEMTDSELALHLYELTRGTHRFENYTVDGSRGW